MQFKHKEFIIGIVLGGIIFGCTPLLADEVLNVYPNPFKITVDGVEKDIEGYNINEYSYFKLRDIGEQVGFDVDFKENTIMIDTKSIGSTGSTENDTINNTSFNYISINGQEYIKYQDVEYYIMGSYFPDPQWIFSYISTNDSCVLTKVTGSIGSGVYEEFIVPCVVIDNVRYLTREVFETEVLARIYE